MAEEQEERYTDSRFGDVTPGRSYDAAEGKPKIESCVAGWMGSPCNPLRVHVFPPEHPEEGLARRPFQGPLDSGSCLETIPNCFVAHTEGTDHTGDRNGTFSQADLFSWACLQDLHLC